VENELTARGLLATVLTGRVSPRACMIADMQIKTIPMLKPGESGYESRVALRAGYALKNKNKMNKMARTRIWLDDLTKIFALLYACVAKHTMTLAEEMRKLCNMSERDVDWVGSMDGAQAYTIVRNYLFICERSEADKLYYKTALDVQEKFHLPDGCSSSAYDKKAYAFINHISPHLAQPFSTPDAAFFLIKMMPKNIHQPGRALREELKKSGDIMDLQVVLAECKAIVHDYESSSATGAHASINPSDFPGIACESLRVNPLQPMAAAAAGTTRPSPARSNGAPTAASTARIWLKGGPSRASLTLARRETSRPASGSTRPGSTPSSRAATTTRASSASRPASSSRRPMRTSSASRSTPPARGAAEAEARAAAGAAAVAVEAAEAVAEAASTQPSRTTSPRPGRRNSSISPRRPVSWGSTWMASQSSTCSPPRRPSASTPRRTPSRTVRPSAATTTDQPSPAQTGTAAHAWLLFGQVPSAPHRSAASPGSGCQSDRARSVPPYILSDPAHGSQPSRDSFSPSRPNLLG